jgi:hypothetical protein
MDSRLWPDAAELPAPPGWRRMAARTAGICGAALAAQLPAALLVGWPMVPADMAVLVGNELVDFGCVGLVVALTLHAVERAAHWPAGWRRVLLVAGLAAAVSTQFKPGTAIEFNRPEGNQRLQLSGLNTDAHGLSLHQLWFSAILAGVSAVYLMQRQGSIEAEKRRELLQAQWQLARRRVRIMRDAAGAARLDPQLLFDVLGLARAEYLRDAPSADALLDRLIDFLRGSLSGTRSAPHTLGQEVSQAMRFASIVGRADCVQLVDEVPPALRSLDMSPGLLLPLLQHWLAASTRASASAAHRLCISASVQGTDPRLLCLHLRGPAVPQGLLLSESRARLADLYGHRAGLRVAVNGSANGTPQLDLHFALPLETDHAA